MKSKLTRLIQTAFIIVFLLGGILPAGSPAFAAVTVTGTVTSNGDLVAGVLVSIDDSGGAKAFTTLADGVFTLSGVTEETGRTISATKTGYSFTSLTGIDTIGGLAGQAITGTATCLTLGLTVGTGGATLTGAPTKSAGCVAGYVQGESIDLTHTETDPTYLYDNLTDELAAVVTSPYTMPASPTKVITSNYTRICYALSKAYSPVGGGVTSFAPPNSTGCAAGRFAVGEEVTLSQVPTTDFVFNNFTADVGAIVAGKYTMTGAIATITANYKTCYTLTKAFSPVGAAGTITFNPTNNAGCSTGKYIVGDSITLTNTAATGYVFSKYTTPDGDQSATYTMLDGATTLTANYNTCRILTKAFSPAPAAGTITFNPTNNAGCSIGEFIVGDSITLTNTAAAGYVFSKYTDPADKTSPYIMLDAATTLTANYNTCRTLTLTKGTGGATFTASPANSTGCVAGKYTVGESVALSQTASTGYTFTGYTDPASVTSPIIMPDNDYVVTSNYSVNKSLSGTASISPACPGFKLGSGNTACFGTGCAYNATVSWVDGTYTINNIPTGTTGTVTIVNNFDGYEFDWDATSTSDAYPGGVGANATDINFKAVGQRTISGTMTGPVLNGSPRVPNPLKIDFGSCIIYTTPANATGATTAFTVTGVPPKAFILKPTVTLNGAAANPIKAWTPTSLYANTTLVDTTGKAFTFTWNTFSASGTIVDSHTAAKPTSTAFTVKQNGTGVFAAVTTGDYKHAATNLTGIYPDPSNPTKYIVGSPYLKDPTLGNPSIINDPMPFVGTLAITNPLVYQDFTYSSGPGLTLDANKTSNATAYGLGAIYGTFNGYQVPAGEEVKFSTIPLLTSNTETDGNFLLAQLEVKSYPLLPSSTTAGIYFTNATATGLPTYIAPTSQTIPATAAGTDASSKFYAWRLPIPLTPANNAVLPLANPKSPTFTWTAVPGATGYNIQVSTLETFTAGANTKTVTLGAVTTYTPVAGDIYTLITSGTKYYWGVQAIGAGTGTDTYTHKFPAFQKAFTTNNLAPTAVTFTFVGTIATFTWTAPANVPAGSKYKLEYGKTATFPAIKTTTTPLVSPANATIAVNATPVTYSYKVTLTNSGGVAISEASNVIVSAVH